MTYQKYKKYKPVNLPDRTWPNQEIYQAPIWCSVDLRDGNQSLPTPMSVEEKLEMFQLLVEVGFKEIEVGFPSASNTEYTFIRRLIEEERIPEDVKIQVLTQARPHLIEKTFESLRGIKQAIVHLYNSTSTLQRDVVFNMGKDEIKEIAIKGAKFFNECRSSYPNTEFIFQYSPESFTGTELEFALEVCEAVLDVWKPTYEHPVIINLPSTVEMSRPNIYADQIEWFHRNVKNREAIILSLHTHNDRGTSVAASELGLLAGADRVEGTLFGNGERTGNVDIVTLGMNLFSQGIDPKLNFEDINELIRVYKKCTKMTVHERHPYAGELVYTAFSGSHQDAIRKGMIVQQNHDKEFWEVPYLPIDPQDVGRTYEEIIRINSQSGKGGAAYIMENEFGFILPKPMHVEFGEIIKQASDTLGDELKSEEIYSLFEKEYLKNESSIKLKNYHIKSIQNVDEEENSVEIQATILMQNQEKIIFGQGNGPLDAFFHALLDEKLVDCTFVSYSEHSLDTSSKARAVSYIQIEVKGKRIYGVGISNNIDTASMNALICATNRVTKYFPIVQNQV